MANKINNLRNGGTHPPHDPATQEHPQGAQQVNKQKRDRTQDKARTVVLFE
jgi:hypothetical protein